MEPKAQARHLAVMAARDIKTELSPDRDPTIGLILGTGWGTALQLQNARELSFRTLRSLGDIAALEGHDRVVVCGDIAGKRVVALRGRVHLNEHPTDPKIPQQVRLQVQMLLEMGVQTFILTNAAGSLTSDVGVGDIVIANGFVTLFAPTMPLFAGEFCSPEDTLSPKLRRIASLADPQELLRSTGGYAMLRGPFFEGRKYDKAALKTTGASVVGMSTLPEACIIALYPDARALALSFVTNTATETHSHEENQARAKQSSALLGAYLEQIISTIED